MIASFRRYCYYYLSPHPHILMTSSTPPVTSTFLCRSIVDTKWECASLIVLTAFICFKSHTLIDLSSETLIRYFPDGWNCKARTQLSCPIFFVFFAKRKPDLRFRNQKIKCQKCQNVKDVDIPELLYIVRWRFPKFWLFCHAIHLLRSFQVLVDLHSLFFFQRIQSHLIFDSFDNLPLYTFPSVVSIEVKVAGENVTHSI